MNILIGDEIFSRAINFFRENLGEVIGAYFDGEKIFVVRLTEKFDAVEVDADGSEPAQLAEKISLVCRQRGWKTHAVGFCLREGDAVTYTAEVDNLPEKEIPAFVRSWAAAQAGNNAASAFVDFGGELWMETLPAGKLDEFCAAFKKFGLNLRALSVMPVDLLTKIAPHDRTKFIAELVRTRKAPNLLAARGSVWSRKKIFAAAATILLVMLLGGSIKLFIDYRTAENQLDAAKSSVDALQAELDLKRTLDTEIAELRRLNALIAAQNITPARFNLLVNLGKIAGGGVRLTKIRADENFLELEGISTTPDAARSYLDRVKSFVQNARPESATENDDGEIVFVIRAAL